MKISYQKLFDFINAAEACYRLAEDNNTKLIHALKRFITENKSHIERYNDELLDKKIDLASVDERQNLIINNNQYSYTKENQKRLNLEIKTLNNKEVEVKVCLLIKSEDSPKDLLPAHKELFTGLVILPEETNSEQLSLNAR